MDEKRMSVAGIGISLVESKSYTVTNDYCVGCGKRGVDKCVRCRAREQERMRYLESLPGGKENIRGGLE